LPAERLASLDEIGAGWTKARSAQQAMLLLQKAGVPAGVVQNGEDIWRDVQLRSRGFIVEVPHPDLGTMELPQSPHRLSTTPAAIRRHAARLGEDDAAVLAEWLGLSAREVQEIAAADIH
jgi:crotonobetainyl-CoA:carnitine CoA-transferase CaiB-like acyl-CoA transferase